MMRYSMAGKCKYIPERHKQAEKLEISPSTAAKFVTMDIPGKIHQGSHKKDMGHLVYKKSFRGVMGLQSPGKGRMDGDKNRSK